VGDGIEYTSLKNSQLIIEFPFICLNSLKFAECRKLLLIYNIVRPLCRPFDSAIGDGRTTSSSPSCAPVFLSVLEAA
jgi:hypothetical protein